MYKNIGTRVPGELAKDIETVAKEERTDKSKVVRELLTAAVRLKLIELALDKYSKREISLGRATELARVSLSDFMKIAAEKRITMNYSLELLEEDFKAALKAI